MKSIQVLLADPHPLIRAGLRLLLTQMRGVTVQAEVGTGTELLEQLTARRPDVLITEMNVPGAAAIEVARRIARHCRACACCCCRPRSTVRKCSPH